MHGNDPPLHNFVGSPQILCRHSDFDRLFSEVPSANNGITFCCGTRYESGEDVLKGIEHFGKKKQLFHVHFRNVRGTLPDNRGYSEVFVDDGDMQMGQVVRALDAVGLRRRDRFRSPGWDYRRGPPAQAVHFICRRLHARPAAQPVGRPVLPGVFPGPFQVQALGVQQ